MAKKKTINKILSPLDTRPKKVAIIGLGPSMFDFIRVAAGKKGRLDVEEIWVVNAALDVLHADKAFIMDDLKRVSARYPEWEHALKNAKTPIITCKVYPEFPKSFAYPVEEVCDTLQDDLMTTTIAYMIAYAIHIKVKELYLFGVDYWYPNSQAVEAGLGAVSYLLGIARERGVNYKIPGTSSLLDCHMVREKDGKRRRPMYGYDYNPGESLDRVREGKGTELDQMVAQRVPVYLDNGQSTPLGDIEKAHEEKKLKLNSVPTARTGGPDGIHPQGA